MPDKEKIKNHFYKLQAQAQEKLTSLKNEPAIFVGLATCGRAAGALEVWKTFATEIEKSGIKANLISVGCLGHCYAEPLVIISHPPFPALAYARVNQVVAALLVRSFFLEGSPPAEFLLGALAENDLFPPVTEFPRFGLEKRILLRRCGLIDPEDIYHYLAYGGYAGLYQALQKEPLEIIQIVKESHLRGRGGAGFPTGIKWELCARAKNYPKYVIVNADEGDPGAYMDRSLLESDPHQLLEGLLIAGYAVGAKEGIIYVRAEYPLAIERVQKAIHQAYDLGLLGKEILSSPFSMQVKVFQGSGAFVCGEETALIKSLEGQRGMPYPRPPYPTEKGLFAQPTLINNVKTLSFIPHIMSNGRASFSSLGTEKSKGTMVFSLVGKINNAGLVEVPMGMTLHQLIFDLSGGIPKGKKFKAVQIGGPSGGCLPTEKLHLPVDYESLQEAGAMMGSGGLVVMDEDDCLVEVARYFLEFTQKESCGKCTFCRLGTRQMLQILEEITQGQGTMEDLLLLQELAEDIQHGALCNLGRTAPNPILTTIRYFYDEYRAHILEKKCPARMCRALTAFYILPERCERSCDACVGSCPVEAIKTGRGMKKVIDQEKCVKCGSCLEACPPQYKAVVKISPLSEVPQIG
ncbi:MAG: NADH-ubiquinone oxidoreductase-F iron-sulfur binding region domain-containing protein [Thermodesulfobacteriota bacterium]